MGRKIIAIDNGKMNMKGRYKGKRIVYQNKYSLGHTDDENLLGENTFNVTYRGLDFTVGANGKLSDKNEGKASDAHILQALVAITRFIRQNETDDLYIMYGESIDMYFDSEQKKLIKDKLEGKHNIVVNGKKYSFNIEQVQILPEGIGVILSDMENYGGIQYIADLGGGTFNFLKVVNGRPEAENSASFLLGVNNIASKVTREVKRKLGTGEYSLMLQYVTNRETCPSKEILKFIDDGIESQFREFDEKLAPLDINIHNILKSQPVLFVGGTSELLKTQLNKYYKCDFKENLVIEDALFSNVDGFYEYGMAKFSEE